MSSHPLKRNNTTHSNTTTHHANTTTSTNTTMTPPNRSSAPRYDSLSHSDNDHPNISDDYLSNEEEETYSDALSGGYDEYDDLNSEAQEYYNSGASELVTTVRYVIFVDDGIDDSCNFISIICSFVWGEK